MKANLIQKITLILAIASLAALIAHQSGLISFDLKENDQEIKEQKCRFAKNYKAQDFDNPSKVEEFLDQFISWETNFIKKVGLHNKTGLTYDGYRLDVKTGQLLPGGLHYWTASSKQSINLGLLTKVLEQHPYAKKIYSVDEAFEIIRKKTETLEAFNKKYPGFGGFFPWVYLHSQNTSIPQPTQDFASRVPALDNGEMFWAAVSLSQIWKQRFPDRLTSLRQRWDNITWKSMAKNSRKIFFNETTKKIRAVSNIVNISHSVQQNLYSNDDVYYLDDPYQGELFNWVVTLFGKQNQQFHQQEIQFMWEDKRNKLKSVTYQVHSYQGRNEKNLEMEAGQGLVRQITVEKGWWFSAHQQWKNLFMPYQESKTYKIIKSNNQKARTWHSVDNMVSGMYASVTGPADSNTENMDYYSDCGIQQVSFNKVHHSLMVTPYSSYPLFLVNKTVAVKWLHNMLYSPAGQTIYGATQATSIDGMHVSPVLTWDSKITTVLAAMGGTSEIVKRFLKQNNMLDEFRTRLQFEYARQFKEIIGQQLQFGLPRTIVKRGRNDFQTCK